MSFAHGLSSGSSLPLYFIAVKICKWKHETCGRRSVSSL
jgi:hypothetical protein